MPKRKRKSQRQTAKAVSVSHIRCRRGMGSRSAVITAAQQSQSSCSPHPKLGDDCSDNSSEEEDATLMQMVQLQKRTTFQPELDAPTARAVSGSSGPSRLRPTLYAAHTVTGAIPSGIGRRLAGSAPEGELLCASPTIQDHDVERHPITQESPSIAIALEVLRARLLVSLQQTLTALCEAQGLEVPPMNSFERWRFLGCWDEEASRSKCTRSSAGADSGDALFPCARACHGYGNDEEAQEQQWRAGSASAWLVDDLRRAGLSPAAARAVAVGMAEASERVRRQVSERRAALLRERRAHHGHGGAGEGGADGACVAEDAALSKAVRVISQEEGILKLEGTDPSSHDSETVRVSAASLEKLRLLYERSQGRESGPGGSAPVDPVLPYHALVELRERLRARVAAKVAEMTLSTDAAFLCRAFSLLLRYQAIGGAGFHAAIGPSVHRALKASLSVAFECCASPLNCYHDAFCSAFSDVDAPFGSFGSFASFTPKRGSFEVNPPFAPGMIDVVCAHVLALLEAAEASREPMTMVMVLPGWLDSRGWQQVNASRLLRRRLLVAAADHGFVDGAQHMRRYSYRQSPYDTALFFLQTGAAEVTTAVSDAVVADIEASLAACTPSEETLKRVPQRELVERGAKQRRRKRTRQQGA